MNVAAAATVLDFPAEEMAQQNVSHLTWSLGLLFPPFALRKGLLPHLELLSALHCRLPVCLYS